MKYLKKFELYFNSLMFKLIAQMISLIPTRIKNLHKRLKKRKQMYVIRLKLVPLKLANKLQSANSRFFDRIEKASNYPYKEKLNDKKSQLSLFLQTHSRFQILKALLFGLKNIIFSKKFGFACIVIIAILIGEHRTKQHYRDIASAEIKSAKAPYLKYQERTLKVMNISIPIFNESKKDFRSFGSDFFIRTSTTFAKLYLDQNQYKIRDAFYRKTYRIPSGFALDIEGKDILKGKIITELNLLLRNNRIEGEVLEVSFDAPIAN